MKIWLRFLHCQKNTPNCKYGCHFSLDILNSHIASATLCYFMSKSSRAGRRIPDCTHWRWSTLDSSVKPSVCEWLDLIHRSRLNQSVLVYGSAPSVGSRPFTSILSCDLLLSSHPPHLLMRRMNPVQMTGIIQNFGIRPKHASTANILHETKC